MKKFLLLILVIGNSLFANYQATSNNKQEVYSIKNIIFYGYDFSAFRIVDKKRMGQELKEYLFQLTDYLKGEVSQIKLQEWLQLNDITFNFEPTISINKEINNERIVTSALHHIRRDSLQLLVNKYSIPEKDGIGYVFIFECFNSDAKIVTAYSVFFDIATKKILLVDYGINRDRNSYNRIEDWNLPTVRTIRELTNKYSKERK